MFVPLPYLILAASLLAGCAAQAGRPQAAPTTGPLQAAPVPDADASAPNRPRTVAITPAVLSPYGDLGNDGFPDGSVYKNREDDETSRGPGLRLTVPTGF